MLDYIETLIDNCQQAKNAKTAQEFVMNDISELDGIKQAIYIIKQVEGDPKKAYEAFYNYKKLKKRNCPRLNKTASETMYVGSSTTDLKTRISQHTGKGNNKSTYALNLAQWFQGKYEITIKEYDVSRDVLQIIEDDISDRLKPAFGKQGGNNK